MIQFLKFLPKFYHHSNAFGNYEVQCKSFKRILIEQSQVRCIGFKDLLFQFAEHPVNTFENKDIENPSLQSGTETRLGPVGSAGEFNRGQQATNQDLED